ncbi:MAG: NAD(P)H-dependent oxidoreductase subunit E, partial [Syntrophobacteraceae bacterium]|nr:NAD(P)H-dependent oxidoreductase subunit E [Syntrophobacteraceae bacterium]
MNAGSTNGAIEDVLARYDQGRDNLIPILQDVQDCLSYLSPEAVERIARHLGLSEN